MAIRADDVDLGRDRALVESFQAGDSAAFDQLYSTYYNRLERYCYRRLGDRSEAEEVAQEAFVRALRAMPTLAGDRRFYPWVTVIASRLCVDVHRRLSRTSPSGEIDLGSVEGGQEDVVDRVDLDLLRAALDRLDPRHQEVLRLREQEGWSYQHIAEHFGVTLGAVETLLYRARRALQREFRVVAGGSLAGIPLVGALLRRLGSLRDRLGVVARPDMAPIVCNLSMAAAIVTAAALGAGAPSDSARSHQGSRPAVATTLPSAVTTATTAPAPPSTGHAPTTATTHAPRHERAAPPASVPAVPSAIVDPKVTNYNTERRMASSAPLFVDVPGVGNVGANPTAVADRATETVDNLNPYRTQKGTP